LRARRIARARDDSRIDSIVARAWCKMRAMCGRSLLARSTEEVAKTFRVADPFVDTHARHASAPTGDALAVLCEKPMESRVLAIPRRSLVPRGAKDASGAAKRIDARGETMAGNPSVRDAWRRRCRAIPADGFRAWRRDGERAPFAIAKKIAR
jgi:putative SOS response-associated peptidase YedK